MRRTVLAVTMAVVAGVTVAVGPASAVRIQPPTQPPTQLTLPPPTGRYSVGATDLHLVDRSRLDPWVPESGPRELMVTMFYPALLPIGAARRYLTTQEASTLLASADPPTGISPEVLGSTKTSARVDAPALPSWHGMPLVVLSPGLGMPRALFTGLAEDLASKGYVVADIGHNYETFGTAFPDGHVTTCVACDHNHDLSLDPAVRAADVSFVLDSLTGPKPVWPGGLLIDASRIGMAGHSIGGAAAVRAMVDDPRVLAGVNMDGSFLALPPATGLNRPFLMLGREVAHSPSGPDPSWPNTWARLTGWRRWLTMADAGHVSFLDTIALTDQLGASPPGTISGVRSMALTRAYVGAFFDLTLRGCPQPLLDGPTAANPEMKFWS
jgi:dienelactone hydrolase